jgi:hypothetical protein
MNAYGMVAADEALRIANRRIAELQREAQNERLAASTPRQPRRSIVAMIRSGFASAHAAVTAVAVAADEPTPIAPALRGYPTAG